MSLHRHAHRFPLAQASVSEGLWITDDILQTSLLRFSCGGRRYGSSVPGPLEARRRLARRRMMDFARVGGGAPSAGADVGVVFGMERPREVPKLLWKGPGIPIYEEWPKESGRTGPEQLFAQPPPPPTPQSLDQCLPVWWDDFIGRSDTITELKPESEALPEPSVVSNKTLGPEVVAQKTVPEILLRHGDLIGEDPDIVPKLTGAVKGRLKTQLRSTKTVEDIYKVLAGNAISLQKYPDIRAFLVHRLLQDDNFELALLLLNDSKLHVPGFRLVETVLRYPKIHEISWALREKLLDTIQSFLALGRIDATEIVQILRVLASMDKGQNDNFYNGPILGIYKDMWAAMQSSRIFTAKDLGATAIDTWLAMINKLPFEDTTVEFVRLILGPRPPSIDNEYRALAPFIAKWIGHWDKSLSHAERHRCRRVGIPGLTDFLSIIPSDVLWPYTCQVLRLLAAKTRDNTLDHSIIGAWINTVRGLEGIDGRFNLKNTLDMKCYFDDSAEPSVRDKTALHTYSDSNTPRNSRFMLLHWYWAEAVGLPLEPPPTTLASITSSLLLHADGRIPGYTFRIRSRLLELQDYHLPYTWLWDAITSHWLREPQSCPNIDALIEDLRKHGLDIERWKTIPLPSFDTRSQEEKDHVDMECRISNFSQNNPAQALKLLLSLPGPPPLHHYQALTSAVIRMNAVKPNVLIALTESSLSFKTALPLSNKAYTYPKALSERPTLSNEPLLALQHLHCLAHEFAHSPHLTPRDAFRKVWWCYTTALRYGAPITPEMSRALAHAGVERYRLPGTRRFRPNTTQLEVVRGVVEAVEGREKADRLGFGFMDGGKANEK